MQPSVRGASGEIPERGHNRLEFIFGQVQQPGRVALVMACALGGTVGILKLIKRFTPGEGFPKDPLAKKLEGQQNQNRKG